MFGLGVGNTTSLPSVIVQAEFPKAAFGQVVSTIIAINQFTYSFGPALLGWLRDGLVCDAAALLCSLLLRGGGAAPTQPRGVAKHPPLRARPPPRGGEGVVRSYD